MFQHQIALIFASIVMSTMVLVPAVAQDKSIIQIYDLGANDSATVLRVMQTMIPENDALAFSAADTPNRLIVSATRDEHLAITKTLFQISNPVRSAITEPPQHVAKRTNGDMFLSYAVPEKREHLVSPKQIAEDLLKHVASARLDVDPKTNNLLVLAPWSTHVELGSLLFGSQQ
ncbi:MAG TPA: hypothetical protein PKD64_13990 [Pirellulaceae bacterium]|nr:hypothetical protein [Pirellulaceae bacterium]HMO93298.1 hypothetical protein [Pirellulaceae bacterium]HMP70162.1 hypothetical protein [Pirellulaceae bacterium]